MGVKPVPPPAEPRGNRLAARIISSGWNEMWVGSGGIDSSSIRLWSPSVVGVVCGCFSVSSRCTVGEGWWIPEESRARIALEYNPSIAYRRALFRFSCRDVSMVCLLSLFCLARMYTAFHKVASSPFAQRVMRWRMRSRVEVALLAACRWR